MDLTLKLASLLLSGGIFYVGYIVRKISGTWLTPAGIWCTYWFLLTFIPLIVVMSAPVNPLSIFYILVMSIVFSVPVLGTRWREIDYAIDFDKSPLDSNFLRILFYIFATISIITLVINFSIQGVTLSSLFSNFFETSSSLINDRYNQYTVENIFSQISNISTYVTVILGGLIFPGCRTLSRRSIVLVLAMTPALALMVIAGAKGTIFLCIALFYGGILIRRMRAGDNRLLDIKTLSRILVGVLALLPFVTISFLSRGLYEDSATLDLASGLYRNFVSYSCAHIYAFSDWFSWYIGAESELFYARDELTGGFFTFASIFKALGSTKEVPPGFFDEYFQYSWYVQTNIYTIFRGLITDFGLLGSLFFLYLLGFVSNLIFSRLIASKMPSWSVAYYVIFCGFVYTSFIISILVWNSMYPTFGIIGAVLLINNERLSRNAGLNVSGKAPAGGSVEGGERAH